MHFHMKLFVEFDRPVNDQLKSQLEFACKYIEFLQVFFYSEAEQKQVLA